MLSPGDSVLSPGAAQWVAARDVVELFPPMSSLPIVVAPRPIPDEPEGPTISLNEVESWESANGIPADATIRRPLATVGRDASRLFPNGRSRLQELPTLRQDANELLADCSAEVRLGPADVVQKFFVLSIRPKVVASCTRH
jgi:hypothetical protein